MAEAHLEIKSTETKLELQACNNRKHKCTTKTSITMKKLQKSDYDETKDKGHTISWQRVKMVYTYVYW